MELKKINRKICPKYLPIMALGSGERESLGDDGTPRGGGGGGGEEIWGFNTNGPEN